MSWGRARPTGRWWPRSKPVPPPTPTPTPVVVIDEDDADDGSDDSEVFIINDAAEIARAAAACDSKKGNSSGSNVINIDDDDDGEEEGGGGGASGAGPSTAGAGGTPATATPPCRASARNRYGLHYYSDSDQSDLSDRSDSDSDGDGSSSDCEILPSGAARKLWEKAALRRTMPHYPTKRKDGRASTSASSAESSTHHGENFENLFASGCPLEDDISDYRYPFTSAGPSSTNGAKHGTGPSSAHNVQECPMDHHSNGRKTQDFHPTSCSLNPDAAGSDEATDSHKAPVPEKSPETSHPPHPDETLNVPENLGLSALVQDGPNCQDGLIGVREKHKESDEYKRAEEEEWASRQRQLAIQAEEAKEAKRLRKRKKAEALRLIDMQKRQKQRLEEVRETQRKGEEDIQLKEQCRGAVRLELENMERTCTDVSSILRALGIPVQGGEVKAAYKRALLKFHPDRVSRTDIYQQVKAEETFKFISRFKEKLKL